ncbi:MAG: MATE family efflux transporter [Alphaproteobacteria bacterium]|nr:MATE family efflux transporter [Alphaproteobacteria bacterium]
MSSQRRSGHRDLLALAWPIIVSNLSTTTLALVNAIWVGRLGTAELGSIGLATTLFYLVTAFPLGLLGAVRTLVAQSVGADREELARRFAWQGLWVALALGALTAAVAPFGHVVFPWLGASPEVVAPASIYNGIRLLASPLTLLLTALVAGAQGRGDTRWPMVASVLANALNFVLDPILVFGLGPIPALGVGGAAVGVAVGTSAAIGVLALASRSDLGPVVRPDTELLRQVWSIGAPQATQWLLDVGSYLAFGSLVAAAGDAHLAAHVVVVRIVMTAVLPGHAIAEAVSVQVGHALGARRAGRALRVVRLGAVQVTAWMAATAVLFALTPDLLVALFGAEPEVVSLVRPVLRLYAVFQVLDGLVMVGFGALSGAGDTGFAMRLSIGSAWLVKLPVAVLLVRGADLGVIGAWGGLAAEITAQVVMLGWRLRLGFGRRRSTLREPSAIALDPAVSPSTAP